MRGWFSILSVLLSQYIESEQQSDQQAVSNGGSDPAGMAVVKKP